MVEINPLVATADGQLLALDCKMTFDDNALFRRPNVSELRDYAEEDPREAQAAEYGLNYVALDGEIGCIVNGAGLAMGTMDMIKHAGGSPANFLDVGGGASPEKVCSAFRLVLADAKVGAILVNIFAGINRCDWVAQGVVQGRAGDSSSRCRWWCAWPAPTWRRAARSSRRADSTWSPRRRSPRRPRRSWPRSRPRASTAATRERPMSILIDERTPVIIQGFTGDKGTFHAKEMMAYGTNVVGGVTPGKGGKRHLDRPVFNTVKEAVQAAGAEASIIFVPGRVLRRLDHGGRRRRGPPGLRHHRRHPGAGHDDGEALSACAIRRRSARRSSARTAPASSARARRCSASCRATSTSAGTVGLVTRSGTLGYEAASQMKALGIGITTSVGIGGDPINGSSFVDILQLFEEDPETEAVMMIGEIGGPQEAEAALFAKEHMTEAGDRLRRGPHGAEGTADGPRRRDHLGLRRERGRESRDHAGRRG